MLSLNEQAMLTTLLTQSHRTYHNINHINACLVELEQMADSGNISGEKPFRGIYSKIEHAIWYHDAVYNPYSKLNEEHSAELYACLHSVGNTIDNIREIQDIILATKRHTETQENLPPVTQIMLDIDLSGFGKPLHEFAANSLNIREEYYNTKISDFLKGRYAFYQLLAKRPTLYYTEYFREKYHTASQYNIKWEMTVLEDSIRSEDPEIWKTEMYLAVQDS